MVHLAHSADIVRRRAALPAALLAAAALCLGLAQSPPASAGPGRGCATPLKTVVPAKTKRAVKRFTLLIRINDDKNINAYNNSNRATGGLRHRLRDRDVFVINTRKKKTTPADWVHLANRLRAKFPCNRIVALNGLHDNPKWPGYMFALSDYPGLWGLAIDWEYEDWQQARAQDSTVSPWTKGFRASRKRIGNRLELLGDVSSEELGAPGRRTGVVPAFYSHWNYGGIAKTADRRNLARKPGRRGFQAVQTQGYCVPEGPDSFRGVANHLIRQYRPPPRIKKIRNQKGKVVRTITIRRPARGKVVNLAMEVSFSNTPDPSDPRPVASLAPGPASKCTIAALKRKIGALLYWAHDDSMRKLFKTPRICRLRPPC
jgi:hypothetical protein